MRRVPTLAFALLFMSDAFATSPASAQHPKHEHKEPHPTQMKPKTEHPHPKAHDDHAKKEEQRKIAEKKHQHDAQEKKKEEQRKIVEKKHQHDAQEKKKEEQRRTAEKKHEHTAQEKRIVETLQKVHQRMWRGDHDYDDRGHEASEHLAAALHELHAPAPRPTGKFGGVTQGKIRLIPPRGLGTLQGVRAELSAKDAPAHHKAALREVDAGMAKIHSA